MDNLLKTILNFAGTFNVQLICLLFLLCSFGEVWFISIPYLLETVWLIAGYNAASGTLSPFHLLILWGAAQLGRQTGVLLLFTLSRAGSMPLTKMYQRYVKSRFKNLSENESWLSRTLRKLESHISPFSVAMGRLIGLGTPLTIFLGIKKQYKSLFLGVLLSSLVFDGIFVILGFVVGAKAIIKPIEMIPISLIALTTIYVCIIAIRQTIKFIKRRLQVQNDKPA